MDAHFIPISFVYSRDYSALWFVSERIVIQLLQLVSLYVFASLVVNYSRLESSTTATWLSLECIISALSQVMGRAAINHLCRLMKLIWKFPHEPVSIGSQQSSLAYKAQMWVHNIWMALMYYWTISCFLEIMQSFNFRPWHSPEMTGHTLWIWDWWPSKVPKHCVSFFFNQILPFATLIFGVRFSLR